MAPSFLKLNENGAVPIIPLVIKKEEEENYDKTKFITLELKSKVGNQFPTTYKKAIKRFEEGTPHEFITLIHDLQEIFIHNKTTAAIQRDAVIQNLLLGELLDTYRTALEEKLVDPNDPTKTNTWKTKTINTKCGSQISHYFQKVIF